MRLAGAEIDDVDSLRAQLVGFGDHRHGGRRFNAVDAFGELERFRALPWSCLLFPSPWDFRSHSEFL